MRHLTTRVLVIAAALCGLAAADAAAQGNWQPGDFGAVRLRLGVFTPQGSSEFWDDYFSDFTGSTDDLEDLSFGADYLWRTSRSSGLLFGMSFYEGSTTVAYRDWVDADGFDIRHATELSLTDLSAAYVVRAGGRGAHPYIGAGGGLLWWRFLEEGEFIDFGDPELPIVWASYLADGLTWELFALAGLEVPLAPSWGAFFEGRYRWAEDDLGDDFAGFGTIDLSGWELAAGFSWNF
ncbi:MAG: hypothetical protein MUE90_13450 [Thermoanaerobaculales bacterium]|jgi:hypothetical protein|nr:hypothetical protein [Thermoanaerobaculales bacterium]